MGAMGKTSFTAFEDAYIRAHYMTRPIKTIGKDLGRSYCGIMGRLNAMGLQIPDIIRRMRLQKGMYRKGQPAHNKGKKQTDFMSAEAIERTKKTRFKKGEKPHNALRNGAISIRKDKSGICYQYIRTAKAKWELLHRVVYIQHFGQIPTGHVVSFKDGNALNCEPSNLFTLSKADNALRNSIHNHPPEVVKAIKTLSKLNKLINNQNKENHGTEQN